MPTPFIHLCAAKRLIDILHVQDKASFYLGSISPDAFYLTPTYYDVDGKYETHMTAHLTKKDFKKWKDTVLEFITNKADSDFYLGYGVHILTDICWKETVFNSFVNKCTANGYSYEKTRIMYYNDAEKYDLEFFERYDLKSDVWGFLSDCKGIGIEGLVTAEEVFSWKENTLRFFDNNPNKRSSPPEHLTYEIVSDFISNSAVIISDMLKK